MTFRSKAQRLWDFIKILRVEPFMFLMAFQIGLKGTPNSQLNQDKICMQWYNTTAAYCHDLPSTRELDSFTSHGHFKSHILADASQFTTYASYISTPFGIIWALFIGAWVDRYVRARKLILVVSAICGMVENILSIYFSISWDTSVYYNLVTPVLGLIAVGGHAGPRIAIIHYMTSTTPLHLMAMRFMIFQTCFTLAIPIGSSLGGFILVKKPTFHTGEIRNFTICYIIAGVFEVLALLWVIFIVNEDTARKQEMKVEMRLQGIKGKIGKGEASKIKLRSDMSQVDKDTHPMKLLFNLENIKAMVRTMIKKRPNRARAQLFLLIISMGILIGEMLGIMSLNNQFIQKVYLWNPDWSSYMSSISMLLAAIGTMILIPVFSKFMKVGDIPLALFGFVMIFILNVIKGSWLDPNAYYVTLAFTAISGTGMVCAKAHISKIVDRDEMGKVMSFLTTLETVSPMIFTTVFTYIFKYTIDTYPGTVYHVIAALLLIPIITTMWIDIYTERPLDELKAQLVEENRHGDKRRESVKDIVDMQSE